MLFSSSFSEGRLLRNQELSPTDTLLQYKGDMIPPSGLARLVLQMAEEGKGRTANGRQVYISSRSRSGRKKGRAAATLALFSSRVNRVPASSRLQWDSSFCFTPFVNTVLPRRPGEAKSSMRCVHKAFTAEQKGVKFTPNKTPAILEVKLLLEDE